MINNIKLVYLASPYTDKDPKIVTKRFKLAAKTAGKIINKYGYYVFSPITHSHPIVTSKNFDQKDHTYDYWLGFDFGIIDICDELWLLNIPGIITSKGVARELALAKEKNMPIYLITPRLKLTKVKDEKKKIVS